MFKPLLPFLTILTTFILSTLSVAQTPDATKSDVSKSARVPLKKCWDYMFQSGAGQVVAGFKDRLFISEPEGRLRAVSSQTTETIWVSELGGRFIAFQPFAANGLFVLSASVESSNGSSLRLIDVDSGLAKYSVSISIKEPIFLYAVGSRIIVGGKSGELEGLDVSSGSSVWRSRVNGSIVSSPTNLENTLAVATDLRKVEFVSLADGIVSSSISTEREIKELAFRANQMLITGDDRGNVINFRDQTGAVWWKFKSGARIGTIVETDDGIAVGSFDNFVYLISKYSGDVKWKRRLEGRVTHRPIVAGKELIFTVSGEEDLVILDAENGKVLEQVSFGEGRYPVADPILLDRGIYVFPNVGGMTGFSASGCK